MKHALLLLVIFGSFSYSATASNELLHRDKLTRRDSAALELVQLWSYAQGAHDVLLQSPSPMFVNNLTATDSVCFDRAIQFIRHYGYPTPTLLGKYARLEQTQVLIPIPVLQLPTSANCCKTKRRRTASVAKCSTLY